MKQGFYIAILLVLAFSFKARGQNLVPNPGFEDSIVCQSDIGSMKPDLWFSPTQGSPDYFISTRNSNAGCYDEYPSVWGGGRFTNGWGYQLPNTGKAYAGFGIGGGSEYFAIQLSDTLQAGKKYCVNAYVSLANVSRSGIDLIQFAFSRDSILKYAGGPLDTVIPNASNPSGNFIIDTMSWVLISDTFVAQGGEKFMTVGNFQITQTQYYLLDSINPSNYAYCYFDDISVYYCDEPEDTNHPEPPFTEISLFPNPSNGEILLKGNFPEATKFEVFDVLGQVVFERYISPGNRTEQMHLILADGIYTYRIESGGAILKAGKIVVSE